MNKLITLSLIIISGIMISCNQKTRFSDNCEFNKPLEIHPELSIRDSIEYYEYFIPIDGYDSRNIYSCIIGDFDTLMIDNKCKLVTIGNYDSIPNRFIKDSSFFNINKVKDLTNENLVGFIRKENSDLEKYFIFRINF